MSTRALSVLSFFVFLILPPMILAEELPANFPADVPIADYMSVASVTRVKQDLMVDLHAPDKELTEVIDWFTSGLTAEGWEDNGQTVNDRRAILAFKKGSRRCGIMITDFVLSPSMEMDETTKGISLQLSGGDGPSTSGGSVSGAAEGATEIADGVSPR
ncbi:MAG: hypothetical protein AAF417_10540 [Pseudomonadota bacterium]